MQVKLGEAGQRTLTLQLRYIMPLKLLTAQCTDAADNGRLQRLMQGDDGLAVPSEAAHLAAGGELTWDPTRPDRPYRYFLLLYPRQLHELVCKRKFLIAITSTNG